MAKESQSTTATHLPVESPQYPEILERFDILGTLFPAKTFEGSMAVAIKSAGCSENWCFKSPRRVDSPRKRGIVRENRHYRVGLSVRRATAPPFSPIVRALLILFKKA